ncbi:(4Fe-4S)-binding protein [Planococcus sp. N064]|uniref:(4Fe-4S)-binding protein n=1 Tax=Planococcus liqunii TaxID=3058394 RepID=A0ABT8MP90_9BACL|nr:(4Fe-4S)-binding protein [Planococcus sp. N064]MDN7226716.1 (4Fe-4S)-binding protein [Planococcus sp. N064]
MKLVQKEYRGSEIDVYFTPALCIHAVECVKGLPMVFDTTRRPWMDPEQESLEAIAQVIERCPSGALQYGRKDGEPNEQPDEPATIVPAVSQQLVMRGNLQISHVDEDIQTYRALLCGYGQSNNVPFCDKSSICKGEKS